MDCDVLIDNVVNDPKPFLAQVGFDIDSLERVGELHVPKCHISNAVYLRIWWNGSFTHLNGTYNVRVLNGHIIRASFFSRLPDDLALLQQHRHSLLAMASCIAVH